MYKNKKIAVVVPAYNEELLLEKTIDSVPNFVDKIVAIDDKSTDKTKQILQKQTNNSVNKIIAIFHDKNQGVGGAIASGYKWCRDNDIDISVVMAGDAQMDPDDMPSLLDPIIEENYDYTKGNRLFTGEAWKLIPKVRYFGNSVLSLMTKVASGYWHIADSQSGYTAINKRALKRIKWDYMYKRYGQPNDLLVRLNVENFRVKDVPIKPVYNVGEKSGIKIGRVVFTLSRLLFRKFIWRLLNKYVIRDFHPLVLFYFFGFILGILTIPLTIRLFYQWYLTGLIPKVNALAIMFFGISSIQFTLFAMWFDMENNKDLK